MTVPVRRILAVGAILVLVVACSDGSDAPTTSTSGPDPTVTTGAPISTTTDPPAATTSSVVETTVAPASTVASGADECVVGTWEVDSEGFFDGLLAASPDGSIPITAATFVDGSYLLEFESDGSYRSLRDEWTFEIGSADGNIRMTVDGEVPGTWRTEGDTLFVEEGEGDLSVSGVVIQDGVEFPIPLGEADTFTAPGFAESGSYECSGNELTLTVEGFSTTLQRTE